MSISLKKMILFCVMFFCFVPFVQAGQPVGTVISLTGKVWAQAGTKKRILAIKSSIMEKDKLITGDNGRAQILFADDSILSLAPATTVSVKSFSFRKTDSPNMALHIAKGITRMVSGKIVEQHPKGFTISSPLATIGIRGTITIHNVKLEDEHHFVESLGKGHDVWIQGRDGNIVNLRTSLVGVDLVHGKATPTKGRPMTWKEQKALRNAIHPVPEESISFDVEKETQEKDTLREEGIRGEYEDGLRHAEPQPGSNNPTPGTDPTPTPQPGPNDPTPGTDPTPTPQPGPNDPTPGTDPTPTPQPGSNDPTPGTDPTPTPQPGSNNPTPGTDPTPTPQPGPNGPTPGTDPTPTPQPGPNDPTPGTDPTPTPQPNPNNPIPGTVTPIPTPNLPGIPIPVPTPGRP